MPNIAQHRLEARAQALATLMSRRVEAIRMAVAGPGERLPFAKQLDQRDALVWWSKNRYTDLGKKVIDAWPADKRDEYVMELDAALADRATKARVLANPEG